MSAHTPGQWTVNVTPELSFFVQTNTRWVIADCLIPQSGLIAEQESNARLIAAAPDLLEALKLVEWRGRMALDNRTCPGCGGYQPTHESACSLASAIAKAEGK